MAKKLSARQKFIQKINARLRKQYKAGISEDLVSSEILDKISGVSVTSKGYISIKEEDFNEALAKSLDIRVKTLSEVKKEIKSETYNVHSTEPTQKELVQAYNSRLFMEAFMGKYFKKYYAVVDDKSAENTRRRREANDLMTDIGSLLSKGDETKARELIENKLKPLLGGNI